MSQPEGPSPWLLGAALAVALSPFACLRPVRIAGRSMEPGLRPGAVRLVLRAWCAGAPGPGQVWLIQTPSGPAVKRLVGRPGDRVEIRSGDVLVNGNRLDEPYVADADPQWQGTWETGEGYFLLGDNRGESHDSRAWGPVLRSSLLGRVLATPSRRDEDPPARAGS